MYTVDEILRQARIASEDLVSRGVRVRVTRANQIVGTYSNLLRYVAVDGHYSGWEVHHIFEALDLERTGLVRFAPPYEQQICVLIPAPGHHRINSVLRRSNPTRLSATLRELDPAYHQAYWLIGNYCGGGEQNICNELLAIFRAVRSKLMDMAARSTRR